MSHRLRCCTPTRYDAVSRTLVHGYVCAIGRSGKALTDAELKEWAETQPKHPAGSARIEDKLRDVNPLRTWFQHDTGCGCPDCAYVEHHMDRDDDITLETVRGSTWTAT